MCRYGIDPGLQTHKSFSEEKHALAWANGQCLHLGIDYHSSAWFHTASALRREGSEDEAS
jgi:hypothetical protein